MNSISKFYIVFLNQYGMFAQIPIISCSFICHIMNMKLFNVQLIPKHFLQFTRQRRLQLRPVALDPWIEQLLAEQEIPPEIRIESSLRSGAMGAIDSEHLRRAVVNVLTNALQVRAGGGL